MAKSPIQRDIEKATKLRRAAEKAVLEAYRSRPWTPPPPELWTASEYRIGDRYVHVPAHVVRSILWTINQKLCGEEGMACADRADADVLIMATLTEMERAGIITILLPTIANV